MQKRFSKIVQHMLLAAAVLAATPFLTVAPAYADWREDLGIFRIGIVAEGDPSNAELRVDPFRLAAQEALGMPVEIFVARDYAALIDAHAAARIEYGIYSATAFAVLWQSCECVEPLAAPKSADNSASYFSALIARADGPGNLTALKGQQLAVLSRDSLAGFLLPRHELAKLGTDLEVDFEINGPQVAGEALLRQFANGEFDAILGWVSKNTPNQEGHMRGTLAQLRQFGVATDMQYRFLWTSEPVFHGPHAVRKNLPGDAKEALLAFLKRLYLEDPVAYDVIEPIYGGGFAAVEHGDYEPVLGLVKAMKPTQ